MEILKLEGVSLTFYTLSEQTHALHDLNFCVNEGDFVSIVGPSGCGKTTILSLISGLMKPTAGRILLKGAPILGINSGVGYMLQKDHLFEWRDILSNALIGLEIQRKVTTENREYVLELLNKYGLSDFKNFHPSQLSGGMRQRAALIRTLATKPDLLLLDEPFSALDYQTRLTVCDDVAAIIKNEKKTAVLVTHDIAEAISLSDKIVVLSKRPATVKCEFMPRFIEQTPLLRRENAGFGKLFDTLWKQLQ